jgi:anthranilate synthase component 1
LTPATNGLTASEPAPLEIREWPGHPDLIGLQASNPQRYPGLFLSIGESGWDILFAFPQDVTRIDSAGDLCRLQAHLAMQLHPQLTNSYEHGLPFTDGWLCAFAYELRDAFALTVGLADDPDFPLARLVRIPAVIQFERSSGRCVLMAEFARRALIDDLALDLAQSRPLHSACSRIEYPA